MRLTAFVCGTRLNYVLREPALQFRAAPTKTNIPTESDMGDRVYGATADVIANPTHRENPAAGKLNGVDDSVVPRFMNSFRRCHWLGDSPSIHTCCALTDGVGQ
jgi:hypothetical protein